MSIRERRNRFNIHLSWEPIQAIDKKQLIKMLIIFGLVAAAVVVGVNMVWRAKINSSYLAGKESIRVGIRTGVEKFGIADESGTIQGFDADVAKEVLSRALNTEKSMSFVSLDSENAGASIKYGMIDVGLGFLVEGTDRVKGFTLTDPYYLDKVYCVVSASSSLQNFKELNGKKIGVLNSMVTLTTVNDAIEKAGIQAEVKRYFDYDSARQDLDSGSIDCFVAPEAMIGQYLADYRKMGDPIAKVGYSFILPSGQSVMQGAINDAIKDMERDGSLEALAQKWGIPYSK